MSEVKEFDMDKFLENMDRVFPYRLRTESNLNKIKEFAILNNMNEQDMKKYIQRSINPSTHEFYIENLENLILRRKPDKNPKFSIQLNDVSLGAFTMNELIKKVPEWIKLNDKLVVTFEKKS